MRHVVLALLTVLWFCGAGGARAQATVQVLETYPAGDDVTLARNQNFYLRIGYSTTQPVQIWAHPYFQGKLARVGSNPSREYAGSGDALGWFFLMTPDVQVDEVRIAVGDGSVAGTHELLSYPVRVSSGDSADAAAAPPEWVARLSAIDKAEQRAAYEKRMSEPVTPGQMALFNGFMLSMLVLGLAGFAAPAWGLYRWRGGWRLAAAVPAVLMAFVVLRIIAGTSIDPTSHNLWPFEILIAGALSTGAMIVLAIARRLWPEQSA
ncbi:MAG: hypothetical protein JSS28_04910 [Proteobacteria bacterium]|nr:hypothetical protein [Pseudomonadota bacterium]